MKKRNLSLILSLSFFISLTPSFGACEGQQYECSLNQISEDTLKNSVLSFLPLSDVVKVQQACHATASTISSAWIKKRYAKDVMNRFRAQFVSIPAGHLPEDIEVAAFEMDKYPVTRELWNVVMGAMPAHVPANEKETWNRSPRVPVTYVNWENSNGTPAEIQDFLKLLNQREIVSGCRYDLPTDNQLWYSIRGDQTGTRAVWYSTAQDPDTGELINVKENVDQYVTYWDNSGHQIQPVGNKTLNAFGIELGNVSKMSKDIHDPAYPHEGRSMRGGSWKNWVNNAIAGSRLRTHAGQRADNIGFCVVRTCP